MAAPSVESHKNRSQAARVSRVDHRASLQADGHSVGCRTLKARLTHLRERCPCSHNGHVVKQPLSIDGLGQAQGPERLESYTVGCTVCSRVPSPVQSGARGPAWRSLRAFAGVHGA